MNTSFIFLADGFEEVEALTCVDVLRRAGMDVRTVSINDTPQVTGAHGVTVIADTTFEDNDYEAALWLVLPGGIPGAPNLAAHQSLSELLVEHNNKGGKIAAICASPAMVLGPLGIIDNRNAVCYPGLEQTITGVRWGHGQVAVDGNVVTGNGPAAAAAFALTLVANGIGHDKAVEVAHGMLLPDDIV